MLVALPRLSDAPSSSPAHPEYATPVNSARSTSQQTPLHTENHPRNTSSAAYATTCYEQQIRKAVAEHTPASRQWKMAIWMLFLAVTKQGNRVGTPPLLRHTFLPLHRHARSTRRQHRRSDEYQQKRDGRKNLAHKNGMGNRERAKGPNVSKAGKRDFPKSTPRQTLRPHRLPASQHSFAFVILSAAKDLLSSE